ncbi:Hypothetical predicted protein [Paramuricea clavata]|nr:Hypothetical predicted protein [Paramuricea clavata]
MQPLNQANPIYNSVLNGNNFEGVLYEKLGIGISDLIIKKADLVILLPKKVLLLSKGVSDKLKSEDLDVLTGCERVTDLLTSVTTLRCEPKFEAFWKSTFQKCRILSTEKPRDELVCKIPRRIDNNPQTAGPPFTERQV